ncbi:class II glutamine amidotransferase [Methanocella arvoryzae]|uniref:NADPH-dependent glutamate synthase, large subunit domain 1 n=1 Tax=Methanocella arvoryzae (strain DSM 22066 / NBRC 105507 / MRE50) TaxID=351160 RepID=Q0W7S5_METAR|nr:glutamine amidotransferase family protein [Methanocella arvoryzae]CAJ35568.1 NADPH-dependent glutamate synthase, large subunit domain 1 [Methanocella arvoryzae MRE50]
MLKQESDLGHIPSGCAISGIFNRKGKRIDGTKIIKSIALMHDRSNGLGGGFAAYGIYPRYKDYYAFHVMLDDEEAKEQLEDYLTQYFVVEKDEKIPTRKTANIGKAPLLWRYFVRVGERNFADDSADEEDHVVRHVMHVNSNVAGAYISSSGKNMGGFKGVGYPEDIAHYFKLEDYNAYLWTAHGRFPTNTPGWWGGAHPMALLDWSVVHNGEISSYGINKRYLEMFGYKMELMTDTEVIAYLFDLLVRRHKLPIRVATAALAPPFWKDIDAMPEAERQAYTALRMVYSGALMNGPFSILVGFKGGVIGLNDRIKLRPMIAAEKDDFLYMSSEEAGIRIIEPEPDKVWAPKAGTPVIGLLEEEV